MKHLLKKYSSNSLSGATLALGLSAFMLMPAPAKADNHADRTQPAVVAPTKAVQGHVVDENGEPMIGVTVLVAGDTHVGGVISDLNGDFTINLPQGKNKITLSYTGYKSKTVHVSGSQVTVTMEPDVQGLDEVVVIGFGTVKKRDVTGAVASVKSDVILKTPTSDVSTALQGRITGLDINTNSESGNLEMRIRGNRSINGSNDPLVIIDGVQGGSLSDLNPDDIESVDVLKDASSTAIYGSQGANGVIIVTTKRAEKGKLSISYDGYVKAAFRERHPDFRSGQGYYNALRTSSQNAGLWRSEADDINLFSSTAAYAAYRAGSWTDYERLLQKSTTWSNRHTITLAGGTERTSARFSIGYANNGDKWKESGGTDRYTLRANIDHKLHKWFDAGVNFQLTHNVKEHSPYENVSTKDMQLGSPYGYYDDLEDVYLIGNSLVERPLSASEYVNPLINTATDDLYRRKTKSTNVVANGYLDFHPIEGLNFRTQLNAHITNSSDGRYVSGESAEQLYAGTKKTEAQYTKASSTYVEWNNILTYNFTMLPEDHHLGITLLTSWNRREGDNLSATSVGQLLASNLWYNMASNNGADGSQLHSSAYTREQTMSYAGRISYDWKSRYLFTASIRRDGSSKLAPGHKWDTFPSAAIAWRISDEPFMKGTKSWLDDLKFRLTYGVTGNAGIGVYGTQSGITFANWSFGFQDTAANRYILGVSDTNGSGYSVLGNVDTKWEKSKTVDFGFDMILLKSRINVTFDFYNTRTSDLILLRSLPTSAGNDGKYAVYSNIGSTSNRGIELTVNTRNIVTKNFQWNSTLTFSTNRERIVGLVDGTDIQVGTNKEDGTLMIGHPIKSYKTFSYDGIWSTNQAEQAATYYKDEAKTQPFQPGEIRVKDLDGDHVIDQNKDIDYIGSQSPKWFAGFNNDFRYKNWDASIYLYARWGHWGESPIATFDPSTGGKYVNMDYWVAGSNEGASLPGLYYGRKLFDYVGYQSLQYCEYSFIKVKRISLGYTLPKTLLSKIGVSRVRVYAMIDNPFYYVKNDWMKHRDPEGQQRSITLGLNVNF